MSDQDFREFQLGRKQIVFLFMALVVFSVAVFLLGISVGRGVREASTPGTPAGTEVALTAESATPAPAEMPPPTVTTAADLAYHDQLQGTAASAGTPATQPAKPTEAPAPAAEGPPSASASTTPASTSSARPATEPAKPQTSSAKSGPTEKPAAKTAAASAAPAGTGWVLQLYAFRSKQNADTQVARLKGKGYSAYVLPGSGALFRVGVGPFAQRDEADRVAERLTREEGLKPLIQR